EVSAVMKRDVFVDILEEKEMETELPFHLTLCQGILKGDKMDLVIQKVTELGVGEILPVITERSVVRETRKIARWQKIAEEATEQCGRTVIPVVHEPVELGRLLEGQNKLGSRVQGPDNPHHALRGLVFWEGGGLHLRDAISTVMPPSLQDSNVPFFILIGPEGGLTLQEVQAAEEKGFVRASLGSRILRAETAAIISVSLVQFLLGERATPFRSDKEE
ncbi:MAG: 16S rRNA (uracil(1498)-N(3))-methyltransferase, partial [Nitrospirales bacterium]|nr:16S rRNA (uracil(1498)-N(3))-methyltransferase [Nitrospirales bacterium]